MIYFGLHLLYILKQHNANLQALISPFYSPLLDLSAIDPNPGLEIRATLRADALQSNLVAGERSDVHCGATSNVNANLALGPDFGPIRVFIFSHNDIAGALELGIGGPG